MTAGGVGPAWLWLALLVPLFVAVTAWGLHVLEDRLLSSS